MWKAVRRVVESQPTGETAQPMNNAQTTEGKATAAKSHPRDKSAAIFTTNALPSAAEMADGANAYGRDIIDEMRNCTEIRRHTTYHVALTVARTKMAA